MKRLQMGLGLGLVLALLMSGVVVLRASAQNQHIFLRIIEGPTTAGGLDTARADIELSQEVRVIVRNRSGWTCDARQTGPDVGAVTCRHESGAMSLLAIDCGNNRGAQTLVVGRHEGDRVSNAATIHGVCR